MRKEIMYLCSWSCVKIVIFLTVTCTSIIFMTIKTKTHLRKHFLNDKVFHINFLKVHKCGSETMANIFFRFGLKYNLTFALPDKGFYLINVSSVLPVKQKRHYDILACHSVYSRELFNSLFAPDTVNIAIIREPAQRMISAAYYHRDVWKITYLRYVPKINFIENLVQRSHVYDRQPFSYTKNSMGNDFGFSPTISISDTEKIEEHINMLKKDFKLVLVQERFDESLILMKRILNWDIEDIVYLKLNKNRHEHVTLTSNITKELHETCFLDYKIYKTFSRILDDKVKAEGPEFAREVKWFKHILKLVNEFCDPAKNVSKTLNIEQSEWNEPFIITRDKCKYIQIGSIEFIVKLRQRHRKMNS